MPDHSRIHYGLAALAALLGALALGVGDPAGHAAHAAGDVSFVTAIDVARWIRQRPLDVRVIDLRADSLFEAYHLPGAERMGFAEASGRAWSSNEQVVVYAEDDGQAIRAAAILRRHGVERVHVLRGGLLSWIDQIVQPRLVTLPATATTAEQSARREHLELSRYFGGTPFVSPDAGQETGTSRASEAAAVARIIRRGC